LTPRQKSSRSKLRLIEIERINIGLVRAYAAVEIEIAGVSFVVQVT